MLTVVIYDSKFGNTERIAQAIARGAASHGQVRLLRADEMVALPAERPDLLLVGGPTQRRGMSPGLRAAIGVVAASVQEIPFATFDTRYRGAKLLMGSAAIEAAKGLARTGGRSAALPESFFVARSGKLETQLLESGEIERAEAWGCAVGRVALAGAAA